MMAGCCEPVTNQHSPRFFQALHVKTPVLSPCEQPFRQVLLVNDLPGCRISHLVIQHVGRVKHGYLLSGRAGPHMPLIRQLR